MKAPETQPTKTETKTVASPDATAKIPKAADVKALKVAFSAYNAALDAIATAERAKESAVHAIFDAAGDETLLENPKTGALLTLTVRQGKRIIHTSNGQRKPLKVS